MHVLALHTVMVIKAKKKISVELLMAGPKQHTPGQAQNLADCGTVASNPESSLVPRRQMQGRQHPLHTKVLLIHEKVLHCFYDSASA